MEDRERGRRGQGTRGVHRPVAKSRPGPEGASDREKGSHHDTSQERPLR